MTKIIIDSYAFDTINKLATPAPEPQESIFDADGWCWDINKSPKENNIIMLFSTGTAISGRAVDFKDNSRFIAWRPLPSLKRREEKTER